MKYHCKKPYHMNFNGTMDTTTISFTSETYNMLGKSKYFSLLLPLSLSLSRSQLNDMKVLKDQLFFKILRHQLMPWILIARNNGVSNDVFLIFTINKRVTVKKNANILFCN